MDDQTFGNLLGQAQQATTVRELHALADHTKATHPDDPRAEQLSGICFMYATDIVARGRMSERPRSTPALPLFASRRG